MLINEMTNKIIINENFCLYLIGIIGFIVMMQSQTLEEIFIFLSQFNLDCTQFNLEGFNHLTL